MGQGGTFNPNEDVTFGPNAKVTVEGSLVLKGATIGIVGTTVLEYPVDGALVVDLRRGGDHQGRERGDDPRRADRGAERDPDHDHLRHAGDAYRHQVRRPSGPGTRRRCTAGSR